MHRKKKSFIISFDGTKLLLRIWDDVKEPMGIVQIFHGMAEHSGRYNSFASFLNENGFIVYASDHRGHGYSLHDNNVYGYIGEDGFNNIVKDQRIISDMIGQRYGSLPLYIFAHSFGSFIGQEYIIGYSNDIDGIILSGSAKQSGLDVRAGSLIASIQNKLLDNTLPAKLIDRLSFGSYNRQVKDRKTEFDWLSKDAKEVDKYMKDELCGFISPINFYYHLFRAFKSLYKKNRLKDIAKDLPILIISGDKDPVGKYGKSTRSLYSQYEKLNLADIELKLYEDARHELLNEINRQAVYDYILQWLEPRSL